MPDIAEEAKFRDTIFVTFTVGDVRFCMDIIDVAARMVTGNGEEDRTVEL